MILNYSPYVNGSNAHRPDLFSNSTGAVKGITVGKNHNIANWADRSNVQPRIKVGKDCPCKKGGRRRRRSRKRKRSRGRRQRGGSRKSRRNRRRRKRRTRRQRGGGEGCGCNKGGARKRRRRRTRRR